MFGKTTGCLRTGFKSSWNCKFENSHWFHSQREVKGWTAMVLSSLKTPTGLFQSAYLSMLVPILNPVLGHQSAPLAERWDRRNCPLWWSQSAHPGFLADLPRGLVAVSPASAAPYSMDHRTAGRSRCSRRSRQMQKARAASLGLLALVALWPALLAWALVASLEAAA